VKIVMTLMILKEQEALEFMADNGLSCPLFVLDVAFMKDIFEGKALRNRYFKEMMKRKNEGRPFVAVTNMASFKRALSLCTGMVSADNIKFIMELVTIHHSSANYKDPTAVDVEFKRFAEIMSEGGL